MLYEKQQLFGIFTSKIVPSICVQLSSCNEKLLAGYTTVVGEADKYFFAAGPVIV